MPPPEPDTPPCRNRPAFRRPATQWLIAQKDAAARAASTTAIAGGQDGDLEVVESGDDSDLDVLVDYLPGRRLSYLRGFGLQERLEESLGAKVDLITMGGLRYELREDVRAEAIRAG